MEPRGVRAGPFAAYIEVVMGSSGALPPVPQTYAAWARPTAFWKPEMLEQRFSFGKPSSPVRPDVESPITPGPAAAMVIYNSGEND